MQTRYASGVGIGAVTRVAQKTGKKAIMLEKVNYIGGGAVQAVDFRPAKAGGGMNAGLTTRFAVQIYL